MGTYLTDNETNSIISYWTSIAFKIDLKMVNKAVTDIFQFFSDSQDFLEGLLLELISSSWLVIPTSSRRPIRSGIIGSYCTISAPGLISRRAMQAYVHKGASNIQE